MKLRLGCFFGHVSADQEPERVSRLLAKEVEQGYLEPIPGGLQAVKHRFGPDSLAIGQLHVVMRPGKEDRLIGDSRGSGPAPQLALKNE